MSDINIILWAMGGGFGIIFTILMITRNESNKRLDKMQETITDIDRRLCRLEGAFSNKDCCVIKDSNEKRKVE